MKKMRNHLIGVDQGDVIVFSDFEEGGAMWTGTGQRERRVRVEFAETFRVPPAVHLSVSMWDLGQDSNLRGDLDAEAITGDGFEIVFRTWADSRVARLRTRWMAIGELHQPGDWDV